MEGIKVKLCNLLKDEEGLELSEYAVAGALIVVGTVTAFSLLGGTIKTKIEAIQSAISNGTAGPAAP